MPDGRDPRETSGITVPPSVWVPKPENAQALPAHGELAAAPVIPAKGETGLAPGSPGVVIVQAPKDSQTIQVARVVMIAGGLQALTLLGSAVAEHGIFGIEWRQLVNAIVSGAITSGIGALMRHLKYADNNPVEKSK